MVEFDGISNETREALALAKSKEKPPNWIQKLLARLKKILRKEKS